MTIDFLFFKRGRPLLYAPSALVLIEWDLTDGLILCFRFTQMDIHDFATALLDAIIEGAGIAEKVAESYHLTKRKSFLLSTSRPFSDGVFLCVFCLPNAMQGNVVAH